MGAHRHGVGAGLTKSPIDVPVGRIGLVDDLTAGELHGTRIGHSLDVAKAAGFKDIHSARAGDLGKLQINAFEAAIAGGLSIPTRPDDALVLGLRQEVGGLADFWHGLGGIGPGILDDLEHYVIARARNGRPRDVFLHGKVQRAIRGRDIEGVDVPGIKDLIEGQCRAGGEEG